MKKIPVTLLILLCSMFFTNLAIAQNKALACLTDEVGGLEWINGKWKVGLYEQQKFVLVQTKENLTTDSAAKALRIGKYPELVTCQQEDELITCSNSIGGHLLFDPKTLKGGIALLLGSTSTERKRDSVLVQVFSCTAF